MRMIFTAVAAMIAIPALAQAPAPAQPQGDRFDAADTNRDGVLSRAEWDAMRAAHQEKRAAHREKRAKMGGHQRGGGWDAFVARADTDKDGAISKAEWEAAGRKPEGFARIDLNKDGQITQAEMQEARSRMKAERAAGATRAPSVAQPRG